MLLGFVFWVPPILPAISRGLQRLLSVCWLRCESELAVRQTCRNQIRTSLTVAVLIVALANGIGMGHSLLNNVADVRRWYERAMLGDAILFVIGPVDRAVEDEFTKLGKPSIESINYCPVRVNHESAELIARRLPEDQEMPWDTGKIPADEVRQKLKAGEAVVSTVLAQRLGVKVGDKINIDNPAGRSADNGTLGRNSSYLGVCRGPSHASFRQGPHNLETTHEEILCNLPRYTREPREVEQAGRSHAQATRGLRRSGLPRRASRARSAHHRTPAAA